MVGSQLYGESGELCLHLELLYMVLHSVKC